MNDICIKSKYFIFLIIITVTTLCMSCTSQKYSFDLEMAVSAEEQIHNFADKNQKLLHNISERLIDEKETVSYHIDRDLTHLEIINGTPEKEFTTSIYKTKCIDGEFIKVEDYDLLIKKLERLNFYGTVSINRDFDSCAVFFTCDYYQISSSGRKIVYISDGNIERVLKRFESNAKLIEQVTNKLFIIEIN